MAVIKSKEDGKMSDELASMLQLLTSRIARKPNYIGYTYNDDMQAFAVMELVRTWDRFDEMQYSNAFAYYTRCIFNSFYQYLNKEKKQRDIRDEMLLKNNKSCSFTYHLEHADKIYEGEE